jgi:hypothetical protein
MNTFETSSAMEELQKIKEKCSLHYLSLTPEERRRHNEEVMKRAEAEMGRPLKTVDYSRSDKARNL